MIRFCLFLFLSFLIFSSGIYGCSGSTPGPNPDPGIGVVPPPSGPVPPAPVPGPGALEGGGAPGTGSAAGPTPTERPPTTASVDPECPPGMIRVVDPTTGAEHCECPSGTRLNPVPNDYRKTCQCPSGDYVKFDSSGRPLPPSPCADTLQVDLNALGVMEVMQRRREAREAPPPECRTVMSGDDRTGRKPVRCCGEEECRRAEQGVQEEQGSHGENSHRGRAAKYIDQRLHLEIDRERTERNFDF